MKVEKKTSGFERSGDALVEQSFSSEPSVDKFERGKMENPSLAS